MPNHAHQRRLLKPNFRSWVTPQLWLTTTLLRIIMLCKMIGSDVRVTNTRHSFIKFISIYIYIYIYIHIYIHLSLKSGVYDSLYVFIQKSMQTFHREQNHINTISQAVDIRKFSHNGITKIDEHQCLCCHGDLFIQSLQRCYNHVSYGIAGHPLLKPVHL